MRYLRHLRLEPQSISSPYARHVVGQALLAAALILSVGSTMPLSAAEQSPTATAVAPWLSQARIAGAELYAEMTAAEIDRTLNALVDQNVSVVEGDSDLSRYLTEKEFEAELDLMRRFSAAAHRRGLKVVWYYPSLEVLSPKATSGRRSIFKDHPSWVQRGINGKPNVFYGGSGRVHWVEHGTESAWMSFHSPFADMFLGRIKRIAATGIDGIWLDVPLYNDIGVIWADMNPAAVAKFKSDTGLKAPTKVDWNDPVWRRWIAWRHDAIANFIVQIRDAARSVSTDVSIVVETVTLDYDAATMLGLDGSLFKSEPDIVQVWEVDALSDKTAMRGARPDDWIGLLGMSKYAKAASGSKPSWIFTYGQQPDDGLLVMAEALAAGNHPYETKIPLMTTTIGAAYRRRMFGWIKQQEQRLFASKSAAKVAVYYSPASRDYLDRAEGTGLYSTTGSGDGLWWTHEAIDSLNERTYLAEYRGVIKWLVHNHVPFNIVVRPDPAELSRFDVVVAPALAALSDREAGQLDNYVAHGGHLVVTGPDAATLDEFGNKRDKPILASPNGATKSRVSSLDSTMAAGGTLDSLPQLLGKAYLVSGSPAAGEALGALINRYSHSSVQTNAGPNVHIELRRSGDELLLHLINPERLWDSRAPRKRDIAISLAVPAGQTVTAVEMTSPSGPAGPASSLPFDIGADQVSFSVPLEAYAMVVIRTEAK
jgi:hypothetical protein